MRRRCLTVMDSDGLCWTSHMQPLVCWEREKKTNKQQRGYLFPLSLFYLADASPFLAVFPFEPSEQQLKMKWNSSSISNGKPKINSGLIMKVAGPRTRSSRLRMEGLSEHGWANCWLSPRRRSPSLHRSVSSPSLLFFRGEGTRGGQVRDDASTGSRYRDCVYASGPGRKRGTGGVELLTSESGLRSSVRLDFISLLSFDR